MRRSSVFVIKLRRFRPSASFSSLFLFMTLSISCRQDSTLIVLLNQLGEDIDAASAGFRLGYQDPPHFSREYKRHFGAPPQGDISSLRRRL